VRNLHGSRHRAQKTANELAGRRVNQVHEVPGQGRCSYGEAAKVGKQGAGDAVGKKGDPVDRRSLAAAAG